MLAPDRMPALARILVAPTVAALLAGSPSAQQAAAPARAKSWNAPPPRTTYYIAPDGNDEGDGLTEESAWQTWPHSLSHLRPGDTLIVMDGTWTNGFSSEPTDPTPILYGERLPYINCLPTLPPDEELGLPYSNGTPGARIRIRAQNERRALLRSTGSRSAVEMHNTSYWTIEGLRGESADLPASEGGYARSIFQAHNSDHIVFRRNLGAKDNRYFNNHIFELVYCSSSLLEENEAYDFHRHGFSAVRCDHITFTRNYAHSRGREDIPGGYHSHTVDFGDEGLTCYFSRHCLVQNTIVEDSEGIQATGDENVFLGSIAIGGWFGFRFAANCQDEPPQQCVYDAANPLDDLYPTGNRGENLLSIGAYIAGFDCDGSGASLFTDITSIGADIWGFVGRDRLDTPGFDTSFHIERALAFQPGGFPSHPSSAGFLSDSSVTDTWSGSWINSWGNQVNLSPYLANAFGVWKNVLEIDPELGNCTAWIPESSPMHVGPDLCIGANILYRYENGVLTEEPLWDPVTGEFPRGAAIDGVNGPGDGETASNVHERLNVNCNGCDLPSGYGE